MAKATVKTSTWVRPTESNFQWKKKQTQKCKTNLQVHHGNNLTESKKKKKSEQSKAGIWKHGRFIPKLIL